MSSESDSDIFFDAVETTPVRSVRNSSHEEELSLGTTKSTESVSQSKADGDLKIPSLIINEEELKEATRKAKSNEQRRRKVEELRKLVLNDEDEILEIPSDKSSLASSSIEGVFPRSHTNFLPRPPSTNDASSVISLGNVGSILGGKNVKDVDTVSMDLSEGGSLNQLVMPRVKGAEPDVVASTKSDQFPVAPPRRKKRIKNSESSSVTESSDAASTSELPSPTDPVESLARELEYSLDLHSAIRGQYVVKPQDLEQDRAEGPDVGTSIETMSTLSVRSESLSSIGSQQSTEVCFEGPPKGPVEEIKQQQQQPFMVRTRSDSGRPLTDLEILAQVTVRNLDTGEQIPLNLAEEHLPKCLNPLSLHIMRLTSEYISNKALDKESDDESVDSRQVDLSEIRAKALLRTRDFGRKLRREVNKIKTVVVDKVTHARHAAEEDNSDEENSNDQRPSVKIKMSSKLKSAKVSEFENMRVIQELSGEHTGAIWAMKFSACGRLLVTAGQDHVLRVWVLKDAFKYFDDMRQKFNTDADKVSPVPDMCLDDEEKLDEEAEESKGPFLPKPFYRYVGHTAEILDVSWSKNHFLLSSSMDKTVRLWQISRKECLCCFQHIDFVTAIAFHPRDDRFFLSGSLDGKLRLWNIPDKKVTVWNEVDGQTKLITALNFCQNGKMTIVGSYDGRCIFYYTDQLKYYTQIHVRSTKGKNAHGRKISGIESMPEEDKILVTSNDSRIRLYDLRDLCLSCKYKGYVNQSSQIKASFSHDGKYIISGSENQFIYIWKTYHDSAKFRRDRNDYWTGIKAHNATVTSAVFAPDPSKIMKQMIQEEDPSLNADLSAINYNNYILVSADFNGDVKIFHHRVKKETANSA